MDSRSLQDRFLGYLYTANYTVADPDLNDLEQWAAGERLDKEAFWKAYDSLCLTETIKYNRTLRIVRLTPKGTLLVEKNGMVGKEVIAQCRDARKRMLLAMGEHYQEAGSLMPLQKLFTCARVSEGEFWRNLPLLSDLGYCEWNAVRQVIVVCAAVAQKVRVQYVA